MNPQNPETWYQPSTHGIMRQLFHDPALKVSRRSARIHKAFAQIWGSADLWATIDRVSFKPPERKGWRFPGPNLHWDTSLALPIPFDVSGLIYLTDTEAQQGAFTCVPGFHRRINGWLASLPPTADPRRQDLELLGPVPLAGRAGDLIIWQGACARQPAEQGDPASNRTIRQHAPGPCPERPALEMSLCSSSGAGFVDLPETLEDQAGIAR